MRADGGLTPSDLQRLAPDTLESVLAYLRRPPVGGLADKHGTPDLSRPYELSDTHRRAIKARREESGLHRPEDLLGLDGVGGSVLESVVGELSDLRRHGHRVRPVWGGYEGKKALFELLESAESSIHIQTYIFGGKVALELVDLLARKAKQGVEVRLMFTASGFVISGGPSGTGTVSSLSNLRSYLYNDMYDRKRIIAALNESDVQWLDSAPIGRHWRRSSFKAQGIQTAQDYARWGLERSIPQDWLDEQTLVDAQCAAGFANVDHRKMILVDGKRAFFGSQNLSDAYFYDHELSDDARVNIKNWEWHDASSIVEGGCIGEMNRIFCQRWTLSGGDFFDYADTRYAPKPEKVGDATISIVPTIPGGLDVPMSKNWWRFLVSLFGPDLRPITVGQNPIRERLMQMPQLAETDFYVEHCYPCDGELVAHWVNHGKKLDDFTMVVPHHYDTKLTGAECDRHYPELLKAGARIVGYDRAIFHTKLTVMDGWYTAMGSYNAAVRSARADLELELFVQCPEFGGAVRRLIQEDARLSSPVKPTMVDRFRARFSIPVIDAILRYFIF